MVFTIIRRYRVAVVLSLVFLAVFLFSRSYHLSEFPIFTDEAIYLRWAQIAKNDANWRFISLTDGKQPLYIWFVMVAMQFISDPAVAGRLVSVGAGLVTVIGLFFLGRELFRDYRVGLLASILYVIYPFALVYDRMALYDSTVAMFFVWALYLEVLLVRHVRLDIALILGMVIGGGMLTKTNTFFSIPLLLVSLLLFDFQQKQWKQRLVKWAFFASISTIIALGMYSILRLSPFYHIIEEKNALFVYPIQEWIYHPTQYLISNLRGLFDWFITYFSIPWGFLVVFAFLKPQKTAGGILLELAKTIIPFAIILIILAIVDRAFHLKDFFPEILPFVTILFFGILIIRAFFSSKKELGEKVLLVCWFIIPFVYLATFGKNIYPRFIFLMTMPLLLLVAYGYFHFMQYLSKKSILTFVTILFVLLPFRASFLILTDFGKAPLPQPDLGQYMNDWPSGVGVYESIAFFEEEAKKGKIYVATAGTFGLMPYAYELYLLGNPNITVEGFWPVGDNLPKNLTEASKNMPTYVVFYQPCVNCPQTGIAPIGWRVVEVLQIAKAAKGAYLTVYLLE